MAAARVRQAVECAQVLGRSILIVILIVHVALAVAPIVHVHMNPSR
jgi:hypothetical protein